MHIRNPLHPSALRICDLTPGRRIVRFNTKYGNIGEWLVMERPSLYDPLNIGHLIFGAKLHQVETGWIMVMFVTDLGVIPDPEPYGWNPTNFVVDHRKAHLLPELPKKQLIPGQPWTDDMERGATHRIARPTIDRPRARTGGGPGPLKTTESYALHHPQAEGFRVDDAGPFATAILRTKK